ncbi:AhpA/YtjB family protein [Aliiglaciecola litoralis]
MEMTNNYTPASTDRRHSNFSIFKRIANFTLVLVAAAICVNLWLLNTGQSKDWHEKQSTQLGRSLAGYAAKVIAPSIAQLDTENIKAQLELIATDPHVSGVSVYAKSGEIIDSNEPNVSVLASFLLDENIPLVFVEEVRSDNQLLGYLRILLDEQKVMLYHAEYQTQLDKQLMVFMLLAALIGILVARAYYKIRFRNYIKGPK